MHPCENLLGTVTRIIFSTYCAKAKNEPRSAEHSLQLNLWGLNADQVEGGGYEPEEGTSAEVFIFLRNVVVSK